MIIQPTNWAQLQHYKDRSPIWIKLHRALLTDFKWCRLPVASKALAPCLWLLASEYQDGRIEASLEEISWRISLPQEVIREGLKALVDNGFFVSASDVLASCKQVAIPEKEIETEKEIEKEKRHIPSKGALRRVRVSVEPDGFEDFWAAYPRKIGKGQARKAWNVAVTKISASAIVQACEGYRWTGSEKYTPHPATWLAGERWADERPVEIDFMEGLT
jgi:hypothetical protein